jgi:hypothetical protein
LRFGIIVSSGDCVRLYENTLVDQTVVRTWSASE